MNYLFLILTMISIYERRSLALNLRVGYTGLISLNHAAFYGLGSYIYVLLAIKLEFAFVTSASSVAAFSSITALLSVIDDINLHFPANKITAIIGGNGAGKILEKLGIGERFTDLAEELSYGQQKPFAVVRLIASDASLLLDEPTSGISFDVETEHNSDVVRKIAYYIYLMQNGRTIKSGCSEKILADSDM